MNRRYTITLAEMLLAIYYAWYCLPYLRATFSGTYKYFFFALFAIGIGILALNFFSSNGGCIELKLNILVPILLYMVIMFIMSFFDVGDAANHIRVSFTFWGTCLVYYLMSYDSDMQKRFGKFLIFLLVINCITSFIGVYTNESAARALTNASKTTDALEEDYTLSRLNISSIYLFQMLVVILPIFVTMIKKKRKMILGILGTVFVILAVSKASFTICFLMLILAFILSLFNLKGNGKILLMVFAIALIFIPWGSIFVNLANLISNTYISSRLNEIAIFFTEGAVTGDMAGRRDVYLASLQTFLHHPFGTGAFYSYVAGDNGIGYHSQILDDMARYGIFAIAFYIMFLGQYYKLLKEKWEVIDMEEVVFPVFVVYLGFLILNLGFRSSAESVVILYILPILPDIVSIYIEVKEIQEFSEEVE